MNQCEARILIMTKGIFGNEDKAQRWLHENKREFDNRKPIEMLETEAGARLVEEMLYRIDDGMFA